MDIKLSAQQITEMKHALGGEIRHNSRRNHYNTRVENESWNELVGLGLAIKRSYSKERGGVCYHLTPKGIDFLCSILKK